MSRLNLSRRSFLVGSAACGATLWLKPRAARAQVGVPYVIVIEATGAWDPTTHCDPVRLDAAERFDFTPYRADEVLTAGNIRYAPRRSSEEAGVSEAQPFLVGKHDTDTPVDFFATYGADLVVINGVETGAVGHVAGRRVTSSGASRDGAPSLAALAAHARGEKPMAYLSNGGYDQSAGLVPTTRAGSVTTIQRLARPRYVAPHSANFNEDKPRFVEPSIVDVIGGWQSARDARLRAQVASARKRRLLDQLVTGRTGEAGFRELHAALGELELSAAEASADGIEDAQLALAAMQAGVCSAATLGVGSFDTHTDHDLLAGGDLDTDSHRGRVDALLELVHWVWSRVKPGATGPFSALAGQVAVVVASDFGRTRYNGGPEEEEASSRGKDHWSITSMMLLLPDGPGDLTVGETRVTEGLKGMQALAVSKDTWESTELDDPDGFVLTPAHIHTRLRDRLGIDPDIYPLRVPDEELQGAPF